MDPVSLIFLGATVIGGGLAARQAHNAGKAAEIENKERIKDEEFASRDREIERRRQLVRALASQNAEAGALGVDPSTGSRRAQTLEDVRLADFDSLSDRAMTTRRAASLRRGGRNARRAGDIQAAGTLLDTVGTVAGSGVFGKKKTG